MNRRQFLQFSSASTVPFLAGCSGLTESGPSVEVLELIQSEVQFVSSDDPERDRFTATIQNTGHSGTIAIALFWQTAESAQEPDSVNSFNVEGFENERKKELYFDANERRKIEFTASPPDDAIGYYFLAEPAAYGANIRNTGGNGRVTVTLDYQSAIGLPSEEQETVYFDSDETKEVLFNAVVASNSEWEVQAEPAEEG